MKSLITIACLSILALAGEMFGFKNKVFYIIIIGLLIALGLNISDWNTNLTFYNKMLDVDNFSIAFSGILLASSTLLMLFSKKFYEGLPEINAIESYSIMLFALCGALIVVSFGNLAMFFLGIELMSISAYILAGSHKPNLLSNEAALKYFIMGSVASAFLLFGIALIYGATGSFDIAAISQSIQNVATISPIFYLGILLITVALAFKVSAAPFHFWAPDVYEGSPTFIAIFMATIIKIASFGAFVRLYTHCFGSASLNFGNIIAALSFLTMFIGNLSAIYQNSFKRMLAFSGVAQAGYLLMGLLVNTQEGSNAILFYSFAYALASLTSFGVLLLFDFAFKTESIDSLKGLSKTNPLLAFALMFAMLSLAGIPPTAGFFGKYYLFTTAIKSGYTGLVVCAVISSLISVFYYFRIIINMYAYPNTNTNLQIPTAYKVVFVVCTTATLILGIYPSLLANLL